MNTQTSKLITTFVATVAVGIPIWTVPQRELDFLDPGFLAILAIIGVAVTIIAALFSSMKSKEMIGAVTAGFALAIVIRFFADMFFGSARHSMLGVELLIGIGVGCLSSWIGSFVLRIKQKK